MKKQLNVLFALNSAVSRCLPSKPRGGDTAAVQSSLEILRYVIFVYSLILFCENSFSQASTYKPFPLEQNPVWRVDYFHSADCLGWCETRVHFLNGDTIINNISYKKLYTTFEYSAGSLDSIYRGALRQDTMLKKVFFDSGSGEEVLYDFNLVIGQLYPQTYIHHIEDTMYVTLIDSILVGNKFHKQFHLTNTFPYPQSVIEGVGWTGGLIEDLDNGMGWEYAYVLKCLIDSGNIQYLDSSYTEPSCEIATQVPLTSALQFSFFPNPVSLGEHIFFPENILEKISLEFYDVTGKSIHMVKDLNESRIAIRNTYFQRGLYFIKISDSKGRSSISKIAVQ